MAWQENLFSNLLVFFILLTLFIIIYSKITGKNLVEIAREIKDIFSTPEEVVPYG